MMGPEQDQSPVSSPKGKAGVSASSETSVDQRRARILSRFMAMVIFAFYLLPPLLYIFIEGIPSNLVYLELGFQAAAALTIALGLWSYRAMGWKLSMTLLTVAWLMQALFYREKGHDLATAIVIIILALFLRFLNRKDMVELFKIHSKHIWRSRWVVRVPMLTALYLAAGGMVGLVAVIVVLASLVTLDMKRSRT